MIITRQIEIYILNENKEELKKQYNKLRDISCNSYKLANNIMSDLYMNRRLTNEIKENIKLEKEDVKNIVYGVFESKSVTNIPYKLSAHYKEQIPSNIRACISQNIQGQFKSDIEEVMRGDRSLRNYRKGGFPIYFGFVKDSKPFIEVDKAIHLKWFEKIVFNLNFGRDKSNNKYIVNQIIEGQYKACGSSIQYKKSKNKWFLNLCVDIPVKSHKLDSTLSVGVDVGVSTLAVCGLSKGLQRAFIGIHKSSSENYYITRQRMQKNLKRLQKAATLAHGGNGRKRKTKEVDKYKDKERNFVKTINHRVSREVIKFALKHNAGVIKLEKLSMIEKVPDKKNEWVRRNWTYYELQSFITYKAKMNGIEVRTINPKNTTKTCNNCGYINKELTMSDRKYVCPSCNTELERDYNAAVNIAQSIEIVK